ncbi:MAG: DUF1080 domain-containing protein [Planctomycetaceae bacterium]
MSPRFAFALSASVLFGACVGVSAAFAQQNDSDGWVKLLAADGLAKNFETTGNWSSEGEATVVLKPRPGESGWRRFDDYLWTKEKHGDFDLQFESKIEKGGNSGFFFRVGDRKSPVTNGLEVQIFDSHAKGSDARLNDHDSGGVIPGVPPKKNAAKPAGEWDQWHITVKENKLTVKLNGEVVNELDLTKGAVASRPAEGYLGFQDHGVPMALRNIKVRKP